MWQKSVYKKTTSIPVALSSDGSAVLTTDKKTLKEYGTSKRW
jgi:hypothetical protein